MAILLRIIMLLLVSESCISLKLSISRKHSDVPVKCRENPKELDLPDGIELLIIGGDITSIQDHPYMAAFLNAGGLCAGTILTKRVVVTAAHCFDANKDVLEMAVVVGRTHVDPNCVNYFPQSQRRDVCSFLVHENYNKTFLFENDIALILLQDHLTLKKTVQVATLPTKHNFMNDNRRSRFQLAGWGYTSYPYGKSSPNLKMTSLTLIPKKKCDAVYNLDFPPNMFCLRGDKDSGPCSGDSGGGVLYKGVLVGIVSHGDECITSKPSMYANIYHLLPWIKKGVKKLSKTYCNGYLRTITDLLRHLQSSYKDELLLWK